MPNISNRNDLYKRFCLNGSKIGGNWLKLKVVWERKKYGVIFKKPDKLADWVNRSLERVTEINHFYLGAICAVLPCSESKIRFRLTINSAVCYRRFSI
jgi:hypothetical protein